MRITHLPFDEILELLSKHTMLTFPQKDEVSATIKTIARGQKENEK